MHVSWSRYRARNTVTFLMETNETMKKIIPVLIALAVGIALGVVISNSGSSDSPLQLGTAGAGSADAVAQDAHAGHNHAPGEGHGEESQTESAGVTDWCMAHRVPESVCTKCNPALASGFKDRNDWCVEHGLPESHCRLCNPRLEFPQEAAMRANEPPLPLGISVFFPSNQALCATDDAVIQFASSETFSRSGLTLEPVRQTSTSTAIEAPAEVVFDQEAASMITLPVRASVVHWMVQPGEVVRAGQMLGLCESPEAARMKGDYLEASADAEQHEKDEKRQEELHRRNLIDAATYETAQAELRAAVARRQSAESELRALGLNDADLAEVREDAKLSARFALRSPSTETLVERIAPIGSALEEGTHLATITDPAKLWVEARVRDTDLPRIKIGQSAVFTSDGASLERAEARVIWVSQYLDPETRTGVVRAVPNGESSTLRANQFGHLDLIESESGPAILVPKDAVQWEGCCHVVFVREADDRFRPRKVMLAKADTEHYRVLSGLEPDEWVVVHGSFLLKTELKKSSIGAGCCGLEAKS